MIIYIPVYDVPPIGRWLYLLEYACEWLYDDRRMHHAWSRNSDITRARFELQSDVMYRDRWSVEPFVLERVP